jgi:hypothetical protein
LRPAGFSGIVGRRVCAVEHAPMAGPAGVTTAGPVGGTGIAFYMNYKDFTQYQICEHTYYGFMEHFDVLTNIYATSRDTPVEKVSIKILGSFQDVQQKWGLWTGVSSRPIMPVAAKMLFSRMPLKEDRALISQLKISKEDICLMKIYNLFCTM